MAIIEFPKLDDADENGLLAFGGDLEVASLRLAYSQGIFPWPIGKEYPLAWFSPDPRGILIQDQIHISRSLKKDLKRYPWRVSFNNCFEKVIQACANTPNRKSAGVIQETWITNEIIQAYIDFHHAGNAFSVEVWLEDSLVGGLYGVRTGRAVCGESMYHSHTSASKVAVLGLMKHLADHDIHWMDTQMVTSVVASLGGEEISRKEYVQLLNMAKVHNGDDLFSKNISYNSSDLLDLT